MKRRRARAAVLLVVLAAWPACLQLRSATMPGTLTAAGVQSSTRSNPPANTQTKPKKKPEEPIDPDTTAGVRGSGVMRTVRVLLKGKPAEGAHVVVKNTNGSLAASCDTNVSGECQVELGPDHYAVAATGSGRAGAVTVEVSDTTGPIVIKLKKPKTESSPPQP
jgi:hypothetical protein